jgi:nucleotide-binding universal stress UspA family protein
MNTFNTSNQFDSSPLALDNPVAILPGIRQDISNSDNSGTALVDDIKRYTVGADRIARFQPVTLRRLLVPLDGSAFGERALPLAMDIARRAGAELQLVHVDSTFGHPYTRDRLVQDEVNCHYCDELKWHKRGYVERIAAQIRHESAVSATPIVLDSRNVSAALCEAVSDGVDLVVMAAYGKGLIRRWVSGSTVHELIRRLAAPLIVVGSDGSFANPAPERVRRILVALDGSRGAEQALGPALALAEITAADLGLLRVVPLSTVFGPLSHRSGSGELHWTPGRIEIATARRYLRRVAHRMEQQSCTVDTRVVFNEKSIARTIAANAAAYNADLIAIASRKDANKRWLGSIAERVVQFAPVPVLVAAA